MLLGGLFQRTDASPPLRKVAIISTPRCGSKYFCSALGATGRFGDPMEWLGPEWAQAYAKLTGAHEVDLGVYLKFILARTTTPNGVFTLNFHVYQYMHWRRQGIDLMRIGFDRVYCLARRDRLAQALSLAQARRTGEWSSLHWTPEASQQANPEPSLVTDTEIFKALHDLSLMDEQYRALLADRTAATFWYEDFTSNDAAFRRVLSDNGVEHSDLVSFSSPLRQQRGESAQARIEQLLASLHRS
jgi:LPS sulfotransferase NodH